MKFGRIFIVSINSDFVKHVRDGIQSGVHPYEKEQIFDFESLQAKPEALETSEKGLVIFDEMSENVGASADTTQPWSDTWRQMHYHITQAQLIYLAVRPTFEQMEMGTYDYKAGVVEKIAYPPLQSRPFSIGIQLMEALRIHGTITDTHWFRSRAFKD